MFSALTRQKAVLKILLLRSRSSEQILLGYNPQFGSHQTFPIPVIHCLISVTCLNNTTWMNSENTLSKRSQSCIRGILYESTDLEHPEQADPRDTQTVDWQLPGAGKGEVGSENTHEVVSGVQFVGK